MNEYRAQAIDFDAMLWPNRVWFTVWAATPEAALEAAKQSRMLLMVRGEVDVVRIYPEKVSAALDPPLAEWWRPQAPPPPLPKRWRRNVARARARRLACKR